MKRILLLEDDPQLGDAMKEFLSVDFEVSLVRSLIEAKSSLPKTKWDLAILDIGLPDGSGLDLAKIIKAEYQFPVLFLTAANDPETRLESYEIGGDDFIPKPFHLKELKLRISHLLKSSGELREVNLGHCRLNLSSLSIHHHDGRIEYLPLKDMKILKLLIEKSPEPVSRDEIANQVWGQDTELSPRTIDNAITRIRQVIGDNDERFIRSVRGIGYQWVYDFKTNEGSRL